MEHATELQRLPAGLWDSLQEVCYRHDVKFLHDISRLIGIPTGDLKKRILGVRGIQTVVAKETEGPWWETAQCPLLILDDGGMWRRCIRRCEAHGTCWKHRNYSRDTDSLKKVSSVDLSKLETRWPMELESELVWVSEDGRRVYTDSGELKKGVRIDRLNGVAFYDGL